MKLTRRDILRSAAGLAAVPLAGQHRAGPGEEGAVPGYEAPLFDFREVVRSPVKVTSVEVLQRDSNYFVRAKSSDGAEGICIAKSPIEDFLPILFRRVIPFFIGKDARDLESMVDGVYQRHYKLAGQAFWLPVASVEQSLIDLLGVTAKKPAAELLGGMRRKKIPVYLSGSGRETTAEQEVEVYARGVRETGAKAVKFKIGGRMSRNADAYRGRTEKLMALARKALGDDIIINADANGSYDSRKAIQVGRMLQTLKVGFFEEPCPWEELSETKRVADALEIPVAAGEQDASLWRFEWMVQNAVVDIVQPDLNYNGGFIRAARVARIAHARGLPIVPHNTQTGAAASKILTFASCTPNAGTFMEYPYRGKPKVEDWYSPQLVIHDGVIAAPEGVGFGIEIDPIYLKGARKING